MVGVGRYRQYGKPFACIVSNFGVPQKETRITHARVSRCFGYINRHIHTALTGPGSEREWLNKGGGEAQQGANFTKASRLRPRVNWAGQRQAMNHNANMCSFGDFQVD